MSDDNDNVLIDGTGRPGDAKFAFEFERKVLNKKLIGFFYAGEQEFEPGKLGNVVRLYMEDGGVFTIAVEQPAKMEMFISMKDERAEVPERLM